jgi:pilus assembly protein Flp/PilA
VETMLKLLISRRGQRGASAVEYGLLVAAIAAIIAIVVFALGGLVKQALFENTCQVIVSNSPSITGSCN